MKVLLLGSDGQLGGFLRRSLATVGELRASSRSATDAALRCDLADPTAVERLLRAECPDLVVNAAAYTAVDNAEHDVEAATRVNATLPGVIGSTVAGWGGVVIHYSTDYVFDGTSRTPLAEGDRTAPLGVYGRSKLAGEYALASSGADHVILRTAWVYSLRGRNFLTTMLRLGVERDVIAVVDDQVGSPTSAGYLASATTRIAAALFSNDIAHAERRGVFHLTSAGTTTWHGFAQAIFDDALASGRISRAPVVRPIASVDYPTPAKRPAYSVLDNSRVVAAFGLAPPPWRDDLRMVMDGVYNELSTG